MKRSFIYLFLLCSCSIETVDNQLGITDGKGENDINITSTRELDSVIDRKFNEINLVDIKLIDSRILVDLKYASTDNFMGVILYDTLKKLYLQKDIAIRLSKCQDTLELLKPGFKLLVFDGVRPVQVQQEMWDALDTVPISQRGKFVSNPALGSVHNFGAAVDLTIVDDKGRELDMGAGYDDFRPIAFPSKEWEHLKTGELTKAQLNNRRLLRKVMMSQKFSNIPSEWWHFNGYSRITASYKYQLLLSESGSSTWFKIVPKTLNHSDSSIYPDSVISL